MLPRPERVQTAREKLPVVLNAIIVTDQKLLTTNETTDGSACFVLHKVDSDHSTHDYSQCKE